MGDTQAEVVQNQEIDQTNDLLFDGDADQTIIKVVGVGGGGGNAVNRMINEHLEHVEFVAINTDARDIVRSNADIKLILSDKSKRGLGAGANPEVGEQAARDHEGEIEEVLKGADMVFITAGMGGGTGTGASPIVARKARELGALTIAIVTRPFSFEARKRYENANRGIEKLAQEVDALIVIPNDRLHELSDTTLTLMNAFKEADRALLDGVRGITELISMNAYIHVDFADVKTILKDAGTALFGIGTAEGKDRAVAAAELAVSSPLLEHTIDGSRRALINIAGPENISLDEATRATEFIQQSLADDAEVIWGITVDESLGEKIQVIVVAGAFNPEDKGDVVAAVSSQARSQQPARPAETATVAEAQPETVSVTDTANSSASSTTSAQSSVAEEYVDDSDDDTDYPDIPAFLMDQR